MTESTYEAVAVLKDRRRYHIGFYKGPLPEVVEVSWVHWYQGLHDMHEQESEDPTMVDRMDPDNVIVITRRPDQPPFNPSTGTTNQGTN